MQHTAQTGLSQERRSLVVVALTTVLLNVIGWGVLLLWVVPRGYQLGEQGVYGVGVGVTAFLLGARHAFDVDHIAVIDNTIRKLVGERRRAVDTGMWFALGHSTVVFALSFLIAVGARAIVAPVQDADSSLQTAFGLAGTMAAGAFLIVLGLVNLSALLGIVHIYRHWRGGSFDEAVLEHHLHQRGLLARFLTGATARVTKPWHIFPVGLLMGLGFDTATQIALLVLAGGGAVSSLPWYAVLVLPVLFAAGMVLFDSIDGVLMARAYGWAFNDPGRRLAYNLVVTSISVTIALLLGGLILARLGGKDLSGSLFGWGVMVDLQYAGFGMVLAFVLVWTVSHAWSRRGARAVRRSSGETVSEGRGGRSGGGPVPGSAATGTF